MLPWLNKVPCLNSVARFKCEIKGLQILLQHCKFAETSPEIGPSRCATKLDGLLMFAHGLLVCSIDISLFYGQHYNYRYNSLLIAQGDLAYHGIRDHIIVLFTSIHSCVCIWCTNCFWDNSAQIAFLSGLIKKYQVERGKKSAIIKC